MQLGFLGPRRVAGLTQRLLGVGQGGRRIEADARRFGGKVDGDLINAVNIGKSGLDLAHAACAMHAADVEREFSHGVTPLRFVCGQLEP